MSLPVTPPDPTLNQPHFVVDRERRRSPQGAPRGRQRFGLPDDEPVIDRTAPVSVDAETGAAVASLDVVDAVPLSTAIDRYREEG